MPHRSLFQRISLVLSVVLLASCGVKGDPIPYVQVHAQKAPPPPATPTPTPTPTATPGAKK